MINGDANFPYRKYGICTMDRMCGVGSDPLSPAILVTAYTVYNLKNEYGKSLRVRSICVGATVRTGSRCEL